MPFEIYNFLLFSQITVQISAQSLFCCVPRKSQSRQNQSEKLWRTFLRRAVHYRVSLITSFAFWLLLQIIFHRSTLSVLLFSSDVPPDVLTFAITLYNKGKRSKDTELAELTIDLNTLSNGDEVNLFFLS